MENERRATTYLAFNQISHKKDETECSNKIMLVEEKGTMTVSHVSHGTRDTYSHHTRTPARENGRRGSDCKPRSSPHIQHCEASEEGRPREIHQDGDAVTLHGAEGTPALLQSEQ